VETTSKVKINYSVDFAFGAKNIPKETSFDLLSPQGKRWHDGFWHNFYWGSGESFYLEGYVNGFGENASVTILSNSNVEDSYIIKDISWIYSYQRIEH